MTIDATIPIDHTTIGSKPGDIRTHKTGVIAAIKAEHTEPTATVVGGVHVFSAYTIEDSDGNTMLAAHAYKAATSGFLVVTGSLATDESLKGHVGTTDDPVGNEPVVAYERNRDADATTHYILLIVAKDEYFEVTGGAAAPSLLWKSIGTLSKPVDQD